MTTRITSALNSAWLIARMEQADPVPRLRALTAALARGDDAAWTEFHQHYGPAIFRQLLAAARGDHDLATEALQQTYLRVARHARPCSEEPIFLGWLRVVSRTALSDCRRRRMSFWQLLRRRSDDPTAAMETSQADDDRLEVALEQALLAVDAGDRALLEAKYLTGTSVRTLAANLQVSPKAIESRLTRARAELRRQLEANLSRHD